MKLDWKPYLWYLGSIKRSFDGVVKGGEDPSFEWWRRREPLGLSNCTFLTGRTFSFGAKKNSISVVLFQSNISNKRILIQNWNINSILNLKKKSNSVNLQKMFCLDFSRIYAYSREIPNIMFLSLYYSDILICLL